MYDLEYLPIAREDMIEIARYISRKLHNSDAAERLANAMFEAAEAAMTFPYAAPLHAPIRPLKHHYRKLLVHNYLMFYWVDNQAQKITVARVIYAKRDYASMLE